MAESPFIRARALCALTLVAQLVSTVVTRVVPAQEPSAHRLHAPTTSLESQLVQLAEVRELPGGGLLMLDRLAGSIHVADAALRSSAQAGRSGQGPGEYSNPTRLVALSEGRTLVIHSAGSRGLIFDAAGRPIGDWAPARAQGTCSTPARPLLGVAYADDDGRLYREAPPVRVDRAGRRSIANSAAVERLTSPCVRDTIVLIESRDALSARGGMLVGESVVGRPGTARPPFQATSQWTTFANGDVAVVRPEPFSVDRISSAGRRNTTRLSFTPIEVSDAHKAEWRVFMQRPVRFAMLSRGGESQIGIGRQPPPPEPESWPRFLPPFLDDALLAAPDGDLWVRRTTPAGSPAIYDVVDSDGRLAQRVTLRPRSRIVGLGAGTIYVVRIDQDEVEHLERHSIPWRRMR